MGGGIDIIMNGNGDAFELTQGLKFVVSNCLCVLVGVRDGVGGSAAFFCTWLHPVCPCIMCIYLVRLEPVKKKTCINFEL